MKMVVLLMLLATAASLPAQAAVLRVTPPQFGPQEDLINHPECGYLNDVFLELVCDGHEELMNP
jgi:hypothetical protein